MKIPSAATTNQIEVLQHVSKRNLDMHANCLTPFQGIFKAIPDAAIFVDADWRIIMANPAVEKTFGYRPEELIGRKTEIFYASKEEYAEQVQGRCNLKIEDKLKPYSATYLRKDNSTFSSETLGAAVKNEQGNVLGFLVLMRDITDRILREEKLQVALENYSTVADFTNDWEYWIDPEGLFRYVSPSCERITGYKVSEFVNDPGLLRKIIFSEDRESWDTHRQESHREIGQREIQFRIRRADGEVRWIEHACKPVIRSKNEFSGFRASNRDITERRKTEEELREALQTIQSLKDQLETESIYLRDEIEIEHNYKNIVGRSNALQYVLFKIEQIARADTTVLIMGETGTGKELVARAIHNTSLRKKRPLVKVNCAVLPANLIESELFGHEKGAFTSAHAKHAGRFEVADGASLFLDEIGELPLDLQAKLLRVLQDGEYERLGSSKTRKVDVRVIAATNRDLEKDVKEGRFRKDLWYRLNVFPITVPPLRDRSEDIPLLVKWFVERFAKKQGKKITFIPKDVSAALQRYPWPGNIRELENIIERAVINTPGNRLKLAEGLKTVQGELNSQFISLRDMEREYILKVLHKTNWKVSGKNSAAEILRIDRSTLRARMNKLGIFKPL